MRRIEHVALQISPDGIPLVVREQRHERHYQLHVGQRRVLSFSSGRHSRSSDSLHCASGRSVTIFRSRPGPFASVGRSAAILLIACATLAAIALANFPAEAQHPSLTIRLPDPVVPARVAYPVQHLPLPGAGSDRPLLQPKPTRPLAAIPVVRDEASGDLGKALATAFATGEFQEWADATRGVGGMVVVGTAEQTPAGSCRDVAIMTRGMSDSGHTENSRQCQDISGNIVRTKEI